MLCLKMNGFDIFDWIGDKLSPKKTTIIAMGFINADSC